MKVRTEDDAVERAPVEVKLGAETYAIPLLAVMAQRQWRKLLLAELAPLLDTFNFERIDGKSMATALTAALMQFPEKLLDLVFAYRDYGALLTALSEEKDLSSTDLQNRFLFAIKNNEVPPAADMPRAKIMANATEEQIAMAFSAIMGVAFPFIPQLGLVTNLLRSTDPSQLSARSTN